MRSIRRAGAVLAALALTSPVRGQLPSIPGAPALPGGVPSLPGAGGGLGAGLGATTGAGAAGAAPAAAPNNIWSFFMKTPAQKAQIKSCFCNSKIGQFMNNMLLPASMATGGLLGPICPGPNVPSADDLNKPATSAQGAAAKIKAEEAQSKAKIAALEYLATVDCRYYPEAEAAMINGLRAEKNECVRLAAAKGLASGCCCSAKVMKALTICVNCSNKDGFPAEASELVRCYAYVALERCLRKCIDTEQEMPPEPPAAAKKAMYESLAPIGPLSDYTTTLLLAAYFSPDANENPTAVIAAARATLGRGIQLSPQTLARLSGPRNLRDAMFHDARPVTISVAQINPSQASMPQEQPRQYTLNVTGPVEPGQPIQVSAAAPPAATSLQQSMPQERKPNRSNMLSIIQDAWRK